MSISLLIGLAGVLLGAGGRGRRIEPVYDNGAGDAGEDERGRDHNGPDHAKTLDYALHQVITNYQRRSPKKRSLND